MSKKWIALLLTVTVILTSITYLVVFSDEPNGPENLAFNDGTTTYPQAFASYTYRLDSLNHLVDGIVSYTDNPRNRWTSYENPDSVAYIGSVFETTKTVGAVELCIFNDNGGVVPPASMEVQYLDGETWKPVSNAVAVPSTPAAQLNTISFNTVTTTSIRIKLTSAAGKAVGATEMRIYSAAQPQTGYSVTVPATCTTENAVISLGLHLQQAASADKTIYIKAQDSNNASVEQSYVIPNGTTATTVSMDLSSLAAGTITITASLASDYSNGQIYTLTKTQSSVNPPITSDNLAFNDGTTTYPQAFASYTYRSDSVSHLVDGIVSYTDNPRNRWTSYENTDSVAYIGSIFETAKQVGAVELCIFNDNGGVVPPASMEVQYLDGETWKPVSNTVAVPSTPAAELNTISFNTVTTTSIRIKLTSAAGKAVGATEMRIYGTVQPQAGYSVTVPATCTTENAVISLGLHLQQAASADKTIYIKAQDSNNASVEQSYVMPGGTTATTVSMDLSSLAVGTITITASLAPDYSESQTYTLSKTSSGAAGDIINQIYEEVKSPYRYDVALKWSGVEGDFDSQMVDNPNVFKIPGDNTYVYMTYVGFNGTGYQTGLARSRDFLTWEKLGVILDNTTTSNWDKYNAAGYIVRDHTWGQVPTPHITSDNKYAMTYLASDQAGYEAGTKRAGVAFSDKIFNQDGTLASWQRYAEPVLDATGGEYPYERNTIWKLQAIWDGERNRYVGFYNASGGPEIMCQAYSTDLKHWTREASNPVVTTEADANNNLWGSTHNADADVVKIGNTWVMFYFTDSPYGIIDSFAVSNDMVNWTKSFKPLTTRTTYSGSYAHKPCVIKHNGIVYHYYCGVGDQGRIIAVDTSVDLSVLKTAKDITMETYSASNSLLQQKISNLEAKLMESNGSKEAIVTAITELQSVVDSL